MAVGQRLDLATSSVVFDTIGDVARAGSDTPFIGREQDVQRLADAVDRAREHEPSGWLVGGDAGVGKTRYLQEVARRASRSGTRVVIGHCVDLGSGGLPYLPFTEVVAQLADDADLEALPALTALTGGAAAELASGETDTDIDRRLPLFDDVHALLSSAGERHGAVLVVLEDVHWADRSSRDLLHFLLARLRSEPVVIVASFRTDDLHRRHPLRQLVPELVRLPLVERIDLPPFDSDELSAYLAALTGSPVDARTVAAVLERSEGNAYFAEELMSWHEGRRDGLPAGLADVLLSRVEQLAVVAQQLVRVASVAGRRVTDDVLVEVSGLPAHDVDAALREAVARLVLVPDAVPDGTEGYAFRHALLREAVYADLLPGERVRLHAAYADLLSSPDRAGRRGAAASLAHHAIAAHDLPRALAASVRAAAEAQASRAPAEASVHLMQALSIWDAIPNAAEVAGLSRIRLGLLAASAAADSGDGARAVALATEAVDLAERLDDGTPADPELVALCYTQLASYLYMVDRDVESYEASSRAGELLRGRGLSETAVRAAGMHARAADGLLPGRDESLALVEVRTSAEEALNGAHALGLADVEADVLITLAGLDEASGDRDAALDRLMSARDLARTGGHHGAQLRAEYNLGTMRYYAGDIAGALDQLPRAVALAERKGLTWSPYGVEARAVYVIALYVAGQWDASMEAAALAGARPPDVAAARLATAGLYVLVARGDPTAAVRVDELKRAWHYDMQIALVAGGCEADLLAWQGDFDAAARAAKDAIAFVSRSWGDWYLGGIWLAALALAAHADAAAQARLRGLDVNDAIEAGRALVEDAQRRFGRGRPRTGAPGPEAVAWLARAEAEWSRLQAEADPAPWEATLKAFGYGYPYEEARTRWRLAETLVEAGRRDEAAGHVRAAHATALELGAAPLVQAVESLVRRARLDVTLPTSTTARPAGLDTLTAREHEVLALLAEGRTNGQIGRALFISPKTASVHVSNLIAKLGATSRTEVVALAYQRGLLAGSPRTT